jgi:hypothetical protein
MSKKEKNMFSWRANCFDKYIKKEESVLFSQVWRIDSAKVSTLCLCNSYFIYQVRTYSTLCTICTVKREFSQWCIHSTSTHAWFAWRTASSTHVIWVCSYVMLIITAQVTVTTWCQPIRCSPNAVGPVWPHVGRSLAHIDLSFVDRVQAYLRIKVKVRVKQY